jgi:hypothetical protein
VDPGFTKILGKNDVFWTIAGTIAQKKIFNHLIMHHMVE